MWCLECDYELINLDEARCPECGRAFDASDPTTFKTEAVVARVRSRGISTASVVAGAALGVVASSLLPIEHAFLRATVGAIAGMACGTLTAVIAGYLWRERKSGSELKSQP